MGTNPVASVGVVSGNIVFDVSGGGDVINPVTLFLDQGGSGAGSVQTDFDVILRLQAGSPLAVNANDFITLKAWVLTFESDPNFKGGVTGQVNSGLDLTTSSGQSLVTQVPEPSAIGLGILAGLAFLARRKR